MDTSGRSSPVCKAHFRNVIIVMTTNAGAQEISRSSIGFTTQDHSSDGMGAIKRMFSPEFRNRRDAIIQFKALSPETVQHVVDKSLFELEGQLHAKNVTLEVDGDAKLWLAERGFDPVMGARLPMARLIQESFKKPLAEQLLFGTLAEGGHVRVSVRDGELAFDIESRVVY